MVYSQDFKLSSIPYRVEIDFDKNNAIIYRRSVNIIEFEIFDDDQFYFTVDGDEWWVQRNESMYFDSNIEQIDKKVALSIVFEAIKSKIKNAELRFFKKLINVKKKLSDKEEDTLNFLNNLKSIEEVSDPIKIKINENLSIGFTKFLEKLTTIKSWIKRNDIEIVNYKGIKIRLGEFILLITLNDDPINQYELCKKLIEDGTYEDFLQNAIDFKFIESIIDMHCKNEVKLIESKKDELLEIKGINTLKEIIGELK